LGTWIESKHNFCGPWFIDHFASAANRRASRRIVSFGPARSETYPRFFVAKAGTISVKSDSEAMPEPATLLADADRLCADTRVPPHHFLGTLWLNFSK
jgi:hypothetical protein